MHDTLYQYLIFNKQLSLPGVGTISIRRTAGEHDIANKLFTAPQYSIGIDNSHDRPSRELYDWLTRELNVTEWDAMRMVNDFSFDLKNGISSTSGVYWNYIGRLHRDATGGIALDPLPFELESEAPVSAEKVIRERAEHIMLVGERERTSSEMEVMLGNETVPVKQRDLGWVIALILAVLALMFIGLYFSEKGLQPSSAGNQVKIK